MASQYKAIYLICMGFTKFISHVLDVVSQDENKNELILDVDVQNTTCVYLHSRASILCMNLNL